VLEIEKGFRGMLVIPKTNPLEGDSCSTLKTKKVSYGGGYIHSFFFLFIGVLFSSFCIHSFDMHNIIGRVVEEAQDGAPSHT